VQRRRAARHGTTVEAGALRAKNEASSQPPSQLCGSDGSAGQLQLFSECETDPLGVIEIGLSMCLLYDSWDPSPEQFLLFRRKRVVRTGGWSSTVARPMMEVGGWQWVVGHPQLDRRNGHRNGREGAGARSEGCPEQAH
jgi:hypothetical protein